MDFTYSPEQDALRVALRTLLSAASSGPDVRRVMDTELGLDLDLWRRLAIQLGLVGLTVPEEHGGAGAGLGERAIVLEELGRALACIPYLSTAVLAVDAVMLSGDTAAGKAILPGIADGSLIATVALDGPEAGQSCRARGSVDGRWTVEGTAPYVLDGMAADLVIVAAETDDGLGLFVIETTESGVSRRSLATLDLTRRLAEFVFRSASATRLAVSSDTGDVVRMVLDRAVLALGSEQVGGAQECLDMAVAYARSREQFGRAIGSFQAVKHRCADMLLEVEGARALVGYTAWAADNNDELPVLAGLVKATCSEAFVKVAADNIQIHGGMGFTWEHAAHLFHKRALGSAQLLGSAEQHRDSFLSRSPSLSG